jgi:hypothetical protein
MCLINLLLNIDKQIQTLIKNITNKWTLLSDILMIVGGKNEIFFLPTDS